MSEVNCSEPAPEGYVPISWFQNNQDWSSWVIHHTLRDRRAYAIAINVVAMDFGDIKVDDSSYSQVSVVTNIGYKPVRILSIKGVGDYSVTNDAPLTLEPGATFQITVVFQPKRLGLSEGGIYIDASDAIGPEFIELTGTGIADTP